MTPASTSQRYGMDTKMLIFGQNGLNRHSTVSQIAGELEEGDLLVVNSSATLPSSFSGYVQRTNRPLEIRLAAFQGPSKTNLSNWLAISFGSGDWRLPTEKRGDPPELAMGDSLIFGPDLMAQVISIKGQRLLELHFISQNLEKNLYDLGKPIQYSYLQETLQVCDQQTIFSGPPISVEPPSASFPLTWELMLELRRKGVEVAPLLHSAGISSTGSIELDGLLPFNEWYEIPESLPEKLDKAREGGRQVMAAGTSVLRALESAWDGKTLKSGVGISNLQIHSGYAVKTASSLITGMHEPGTSHMDILGSFCPIHQIQTGYAEAEKMGYRGHEYGDISLLVKKLT